MSVNEIKAPKRFDKLVLAVAIGIFVSLAGGTIREYRNYRQGLMTIEQAKGEIEELRGRKERLEKLIEEAEKPEFIEKQLREKLGLVREGETIAVLPTTEPELVDLKMEGKTVTRKTYWGEWLKLLQ